MGLPAIAGVAGALLSRIEGIARSKSQAPAANTPLAGNDRVKVSDPGLLFTQLGNLSQQNPTEFGKITSQIAHQLQAANTSNSNQALSQLASNFQHASKTGKFSDLFSHSSSASSQGTATSGSADPLHSYAESGSATLASTVSSVFSQALSQIKIDLGSTAALKLSS